MILPSKSVILGKIILSFASFSLLSLFGRERETVEFNWDDQVFKSEQERAFWMAIPNWGERRTDHYRFRYNQDGKKIQYFQTNGYSGYAKGYFIEEGVGYLKMVVQLKDGWVTMKKVWYSNGEKHIFRNYTKGILNGRYIDWHSNGVRSLDGMTKNGKKQGLWTGWHLNGQKKEEGQWVNGRAHGVFEDWYPIGGKKAEQVFKDGELISAVVWKPDGEKCGISAVLSGKGVLVEYDGSGEEIGRNLIVSGKKLASK